MKKMKIITLALTLLLALSLAACGDNGNTQGDSAGISVTERAALTPSKDAPTTPTEATPAHETEVTSPDLSTSPAVTGSATNTEYEQKISADITAANAYVVNMDSGTVLYQKNSAERIAPASTAKMLTALTVLDYCSLDDTFTVGSEIDLIAADSSVAWLNSGDKLTVKQLLAALLLPSGNDAAYTLAFNAGKRIAGDNGLSVQQAVKAFVDAMNAKAKEVGAISSHFANPDGYDADGQYTTAFDLAQIAKACLENDALAEMMGSYKIGETLVSGREITYTNTNKLIDPNSQYYYSNAIGLKTGSTKDAGSCLVSAAVIDGATYICVVMGGSAEIRFSDSLKLYKELDPALSIAEISEPPIGAPGRMRERPQMP